jgi:hypothetical protein
LLGRTRVQTRFKSLLIEAKYSDSHESGKSRTRLTTTNDIDFLCGGLFCCCCDNAWTSDERTNHFVFIVGRGDGNIFDKNIFLASIEVQNWALNRNLSSVGQLREKLWALKVYYIHCSKICKLRPTLGRPFFLNVSLLDK